MSLATIVRKLWVGMRLRCPNCERGHTFRGLFKANTVCDQCSYLFEAREGESVGGMYINLGLAELLSLGGYLVVEALTDIPLWPQLIFWVTFNIVFLLFFYRHSRSMWMSIAYLAGGQHDDGTVSRAENAPTTSEAPRTGG